MDFGRLGLRHVLSENHQAVDDHRNQEQTDLNLPGKIIGHEDRCHTAQDQTSRPTGVQNIQVVSLIVRKQRGRQRIDDRFANAVANREQKHADKQRPVSRVLTGGLDVSQEAGEIVFQVDGISILVVDLDEVDVDVMPRGLRCAIEETPIAWFHAELDRRIEAMG